MLAAKIDAMDYEEGKTLFTIVPPVRYDNTDDQSTYENYFWSFFCEITGVAVLFEGTSPV